MVVVFAVVFWGWTIFWNLFVGVWNWLVGVWNLCIYVTNGLAGHTFCPPESWILDLWGIYLPPICGKGYGLHKDKHHRD